MFAGPNGSGKSTLKSYLPPVLLGVYLNSKKPMDIGFTGPETRNTRHEAEFYPPAR